MANVNTSTFDHWFVEVDEITKAVHGKSGAEIAADIVGYQRAVHLAKRLSRAFFDLHLDRIVSRSWVTPSATGLIFESLSLKEAERLVGALEDSGNGRSAPIAGPGCNQLRLF